MLQFYFIRHAQSTNNLLWDITSSSNSRSEDPPLTDLGREQASHLAEFLLRGNPDGGNIATSTKTFGFSLTHLYTSLMLRAVETGMPVANTLCLPLIAWEDLHEQGGIYLTNEETGEPIGLPGKNRSYFQEFFPELLLPSSIDEAGWWRRRPYETPEQSVLRAQHLITDLLELHDNSNDRVAVICHGGFYNSFLAVLLNLPIQNELWFRMNNAAITRIDFQDDVVRLIYMNRMDYLPAELIT
jgi:2,3-bisphosphoglycerate-dependent phosphoglycerate mutase